MKTSLTNVYRDLRLLNSLNLIGSKILRTNSKKSMQIIRQTGRISSKKNKRNIARNTIRKRLSMIKIERMSLD